MQFYVVHSLQVEGQDVVDMLYQQKHHVNSSQVAFNNHKCQSHQCDIVEKKDNNWMVLEGNERGTLHKSAAKKKSTPRCDTEEKTATVLTCLQNE